MEKYVDEVFEIIADHVAEICSDIDHDPITKSSMLSPLGMDSIGRALLIERVIEVFELSVPRFEFYQANNLGELAEIFAKKLREKQMAELTNVKV